MRCYEVKESVWPGIRIARFPEPHVPVLGREPLLLDQRFSNFIKEIPRELPGDLLLQTAVVMTGREVRLAPEPPGWRDRKALVRVMTQTTLGGTITFTSTCFTERVENGQVVKAWDPKPTGVDVIIGGPAVAIDDEALTLDLLLVMGDGSSFRIARTGDLEANEPIPPEIFVRCRSGQLELRTDALENPTRRRRQRRRKSKSNKPGSSPRESLRITTHRS